MQPIDAVSLIEARKKEIQSIEESILKSNKKSMLFQRLPFYKRRRNRNFDKRKKKFSFRKRDRHFLRTHNFYAKRFFMGKIEDHSLLYSPNQQSIDSNNGLLYSLNQQSIDSNNGLLYSLNKQPIDNKQPTDKKVNFYSKMTVPLKRRIKSSKFIYKSLKSGLGFVFDESFRGGVEIFTSDIHHIADCNDNNNINTAFDNFSPCGLMNEILLQNYINKIDVTKYNEVQSIDNLFEIIIGKDKSFIIGAIPKDVKVTKRLETILSLINCTSIRVEPSRLGVVGSSDSQSNNSISHGSNPTNTNNLNPTKNTLNAIIFPNGNSKMMESHKILCKRNETMEIFQSVLNKGVVPICLEEIDRISLEKDQMTVYDRIDTRLFKAMEEMKNREMIEKYNRTPKGKRNEICIEDLFIHSSRLFSDSATIPGENLIPGGVRTNMRSENNSGENLTSAGARTNLHNTDNLTPGGARTNLHNNRNTFYYVFMVKKGSVSPAAEIYDEDSCIGKVVKIGFKFTKARCFGLACLNRRVEMEEPFYCKNIGKREFYEIEFTLQLC